MKVLVEVADTRISSSEFGEYHYQLFVQWAFIERQSKAAFLRNIAVARTEANRSEVDDGLEFYANRYRMTVQELIDRIAELDQQKLSISQIHQRLDEESQQRGE